MNAVFCDTSALFAVLDRDSDLHADAARNWQALVGGNTPLVTTNYIIIEITALLQRRIGLDAVRRFQHDMLPIIEITWIDETAHSRAMESMLTSNRRLLSLVDCVSFDTMRQLSISTAFAFDQHFSEQGFTPYS